MHNIEDYVVQNVIKIYLRHCFEVIPKRWPGWRWTENELARRAGKFFVYISTVKQFVGDPYIGDPRSQLDILLNASSPSDTAKYPSSLYHFLDHLYLNVLQNAMPLIRREQMVPRYQRVVGTIITMVDPLPVTSLARLVDLSVTNIKSALAFLPSVISAPTSNDEKPQIYHPSFPDFITDSDRCKDPDLIIIRRDHHHHLAVRCLLLMRDHLTRDICEIEDQSKLNSEVEGLDEKAKRAIPPWLRCALLHWETHLEQTQHGDIDVKGHLELFCTKGLLYWVEALSVLGRMEVAIPTIEHHAAQIWDSTDGKHPVTLKGHRGEVTSTTFSPNGKLIATESHDNTARIWDPNNGKHLVTLEGCSGHVSSVTFSLNSEYIATGSRDNSTRIWDSIDGTHLQTVHFGANYTDTIHRVQFSEDNSYILVCVQDWRTAEYTWVRYGLSISSSNPNHGIVGGLVARASMSVVSSQHNVLSRCWKKPDVFPIVFFRPGRHV